MTDNINAIDSSLFRMSRCFFYYQTEEFKFQGWEHIPVMTRLFSVLQAATCISTLWMWSFITLITHLFSAESTSNVSCLVRFASSSRASFTEFSLLWLTRRYSKTAVVPLFFGNVPEIRILRFLYVCIARQHFFHFNQMSSWHKLWVNGAYRPVVQTVGPFFFPQVLNHLEPDTLLCKVYPPNLCQFSGKATVYFSVFHRQNRESLKLIVQV